MDEQRSVGKLVKSLLFDFAFLLIMAVAFAEFLGHGFTDWRMILGMVLFGSVTLMMGWNQKMGMLKAKKLSDEIVAKHRAEPGAGTVEARR